TEQEAGERVAVVVGGKAELAGLVELIAKDDPGARDVGAKREGMGAMHPTGGVIDSVLIASERGWISLADAEVSRNREGFDDLVAGRLIELCAEISDADTARSGTSIGYFARDAQAEIVEERGGERMGFAEHEVMRIDGGEALVVEVILGIEKGSVVEAIEK